MAPANVAREFERALAARDDAAALALVAPAGALAPNAALAAHAGAPPLLGAAARANCAIVVRELLRRGAKSDGWRGARPVAAACETGASALRELAFD